jgi:hypothetical protein
MQPGGDLDVWAKERSCTVYERWPGEWVDRVRRGEVGGLVGE